MANSPISIDIIQFDVRNPDLTEVYVFLTDIEGDAPYMHGWKHKSYPAKFSTLEIHGMLFTADAHNPFLWYQGAPK